MFKLKIKTKNDIAKYHNIMFTVKLIKENKYYLQYNETKYDIFQFSPTGSNQYLNTLSFEEVEKHFCSDLPHVKWTVIENSLIL